MRISYTTGFQCFHPNNEQFKLKSFIVIRTAFSEWIPWVATQDDLLAEDWMI